MDSLPPLIPSPSGPPTTTPEDRIHAQHHMAFEGLQSLGSFYALGSFFGLGIRPFHPVAAEKLTHGITSFNLPHPPQPKMALPRPGRSALLYLAPPPLGSVPPEVYGLRPDFAARNPDQDDTGTFRWISKNLLGTLPGEERLKYAAQVRADERERSVREWAPFASRGALIDELNVYTNPQFQIDQPEARADVLAKIIRDEIIRRGDDNLIPFELAPGSGSGGSFPDSLLPTAGSGPMPPAPVPADNFNNAVAPLTPPAPGAAPPGAGAVRPWIEEVNDGIADYLRSMSNNWFGR